MPKFDGTPYTQLTSPARGDVQGIIKDVSEALAENQTKYATQEDLHQFGSWASKVRSVTASGTITIANTDPMFVEINPNGSDRTVNFPAKSDDNHGYFMRHSGSANTLTLKRSGGATITTLTAGEVKYIMPSTLNDFTAQSGSSSSSTSFLLCEGRLTLETGVAVSTSAQTDKTTLYFTPFRGNRISLYDGSAWADYTFSELSLSISAFTASKPYDIFIYNNAGTLTLEGLVWTNDTTRATALVLRDGIYCKTGALTRRYLGTIYMDAASKCQDKESHRYVWNYYNRIPRKLKVSESTISWNYTTATWRSANNSTSNRVNLITGVAENPVNLRVMVSTTQTSAAYRAAGIGLDKTNGNDADLAYFNNGAGSGAISASYYAIPTVGFHYFQWTEQAEAVGTCTWYSNAIGTFAGIMGEVFG